MLGDVNKSLKSFLCYGLRSEENLASLNSHFDQIANILINNEQNGGPSGESREQILARILSLEIEIDKIHQINNQVINQSNINEVIDQMTDRNKKVETINIIFKLETIQKQLEATVDEKSEEIENFRTCQICFENYDYEQRHRSILSVCGHVLCSHCATTILDNAPKDKAVCPTCRRSFSSDHIIKIFEATIS